MLNCTMNLSNLSLFSLLALTLTWASPAEIDRAGQHSFELNVTYIMLRHIKKKNNFL